ncbi:MAG: MFS transporter [Nitrososphaerales archaeon]
MGGANKVIKSLGRSGWFSLIPFYAAVQGVSVYIPLAIIRLGGDVRDVSFAASAYNLALIPTTLLWGYLCDVTGLRKGLIYLASLVSFLCSTAFYFSNNVALLIIIFGVYSQTASLFAPAFNLLILETLPKKSWEKGYTLSNLYMFIGQIIGMVAGVVWTIFFSVSTYPLLSAVFSIVGLLTALTLPKPKVLLERRSILWSAQGLIHKMTHLPLIFVRRPRLTDYKSVAAMGKRALTREIPMIFAAAFLFMLSANFFFTPYTPYLKHTGLSDSQVIFLNIYIVAANAITSQFLLKRFSGKVSHSVASRALMARAIGMLLGAFFASFAVDEWSFYTTMLIYTLLGSAYATININLTSLLFKALPLGKQGGLLGVFSSLNGLASLVGAFASGYSAYYLGYTATFFIAALLVFLASILLELHYQEQ